MDQEEPGQTLQATALVHEASMRLVDVQRVQRWDSRGHFFAAAAEAMRRLLVEQYRRKQRIKHGGELQRVPLPDIVANRPEDNLETLDEALEELAAEDELAAKIVELRYFAGLGHEQIAEFMGITVYEDTQEIDLRPGLATRKVFTIESTLDRRQWDRLPACHGQNDRLEAHPTSESPPKDLARSSADHPVL